MRPLEFELHKTLPLKPFEISSQIADVSNWSDFGGYAFLPGIERAEYETRTAEMKGSRISVKNRDGSHHIEEVLEWDENRKIVLKLHEFSKPLDRLATHFIEEWNFQESGENETKVLRRFELHPRNSLTRPFIWFISIFFKKAIRKHLDEMV